MRARPVDGYPSRIASKEAIKQVGLGESAGIDHWQLTVAATQQRSSPLERIATTPPRRRSSPCRFVHDKRLVD